MSKGSTNGQEPLWIHNPEVLIKGDFKLGFSSSESEIENCNSMARLIILCAVVSAIILKSPVTVAMVLSLLFFAVPSGNSMLVPDSQTAKSLKFCQSPSETNPLANPNPSDFGSNNMKLPACPTSAPKVRNLIKEELNSQDITGLVIDAAGGSLDSMKMANRAFYSVPGTTVPADRDGFMHALYGDTIDRTMNQYY